MKKNSIYPALLVVAYAVMFIGKFDRGHASPEFHAHLASIMLSVGAIFFALLFTFWSLRANRYNRTDTVHDVIHRLLWSLSATGLVFYSYVLGGEIESMNPLTWVQSFRSTTLSIYIFAPIIILAIMNTVRNERSQETCIA